MSGRAPAGAATQRVETIDYAKGVGILLVVAAHAWRGLEAAKVPLPQPAFAAIDRWVYGFHMPLFFVVSGLFLYRSAERPAAGYLAEKSATLLWPYVLWATLYWQLGALATRGPHPSPAAFAASLVTIPPGSHLWFLYVLFAIAVVMLALRKVGLPAWAVLVASVGVYLAARHGAFHLKVAAATGWALDRPLFQFAMFFPYVAAAATLAGPVLAACARLPITLWVAVSVAGAAVVTYEAARASADASMFNFVSGAAGTLMVLGVARVLEHDRVWPVRLLGERSLEIYLVHILAAAAARMALARLAPDAPWWVHLPVGLAAGLGVPLALALACDRVRVPLLFRLPLPRGSGERRAPPR